MVANLIMSLIYELKFNLNIYAQEKVQCVVGSTLGGFQVSAEGLRMYCTIKGRLCFKCC